VRVLAKGKTAQVAHEDTTRIADRLFAYLSENRERIRLK